MTSSSFRIIVWPDTQCLFDGERIRGDYIRHSLAEIAEDDDPPPLAFIHLGDVVEHGYEEEYRYAQAAFDCSGTSLEDVTWLWLAGNHDLAILDEGVPASQTPFLETFGPAFPGVSSNITWSEDGYSWIARFPSKDLILAGISYGVSADTLDWVASHLSTDTPAILVAHDAALGDALTEAGNLIWQHLIEPCKQIFLIICGHEWPDSRFQKNRKDGSSVEVHLANYQNLFSGGAGMIREYRFEPDHNLCSVKTWCPALARDKKLSQNVAARIELASARESSQFRFTLKNPTRNDVPWQIPPQSRFIFSTDQVGQFTLPNLSGKSIALHARFKLPDRDLPWQIVAARTGTAPNGSNDPLIQLAISSERFISCQIFHTDGCLYATSQAMDLNSLVDVVLVTKGQSGMWVNGDEITRTNFFEPQLTPGTSRVSPSPHLLTDVPEENWSIGDGGVGNKYQEQFKGSLYFFRLWELTG